ncbi:hypothetical protein [Cryptosporangium sp. NPDC051539]|uniref:hypothetical protein n=1 Tax=Cryptosporangium sp. NPDC051539 TaxID=3363962 RepID=UPI0037B0116D
MSGLVRRAAGTMAVLAVLGAVPACGGNDEDRAICDSVKEELRSVTRNAADQVTDPPVEAETYRNGAARIRAFGKQATGDVADASFDIADAMKHLAGVIEVEGPPKNPVVPDMTALNKAGAKLQSACD